MTKFDQQNIKGAVWSGGLNFPGSSPPNKPLAQSFFYPNSTDLANFKRPSGQSFIESDVKPVPHCIQKLSTLRQAYVLNIANKKTKRQFR